MVCVLPWVSLTPSPCIILLCLSLRTTVSFCPRFRFPLLLFRGVVSSRVVGTCCVCVLSFRFPCGVHSFSRLLAFSARLTCPLILWCPCFLYLFIGWVYFSSDSVESPVSSATGSYLWAESVPCGFSPAFFLFVGPSHACGHLCVGLLHLVPSWSSSGDPLFLGSVRLLFRGSLVWSWVLGPSCLSVIFASGVSLLCFCSLLGLRFLPQVPL